MAFFGVSYWDQTVVAWFALLAMISAATAKIDSKKAVPVEAERAPEAELAYAYGPGAEDVSIDAWNDGGW
jgi:hypothetical protein